MSVAIWNTGTGFSFFSVGQIELDGSYYTTVGNFPVVLDHIDSELYNVPGTEFTVLGFGS